MGKQQCLISHTTLRNNTSNRKKIKILKMWRTEKEKKLLSRERIGGRPNPRYAFPKASLLQDQGCHIRHTGSNFTSQFNAARKYSPPEPNNWLIHPWQQQPPFGACGNDGKGGFSANSSLQNYFNSATLEVLQTRADVARSSISTASGLDRSLKCD